MQKIVIQGIGYVGLAMLTFCAGAKRGNKFLYNVVGIEKKSKKGTKIVQEIKSKKIPKIVDDKKFHKFYNSLQKKKRIKVNTDTNEYKDADIIFICSNCDYDFKKNKINLKAYLKNIEDITNKIKKNCLIVIQTTLPPGTTQKLIKPLIIRSLKKRGINNFYLSHSFERITPGKDYYISMKKTKRIIGGICKISSLKTSKVFKDIFELSNDKITIFDSPSESETCKIIENSYRATNIAFIEEWRKFCAANNLDLETILNCIRKRKTHNNIMHSGIGVGGYCLTKDPLFGAASSKQVLNQKLEFPLSVTAVNVNQKMSYNIMGELKKKFKNLLIKKKVLLLGVSYRQDTNDTRNSPAEDVFDFLKKMKCNVSFFDPNVDYWNYIDQRSISKNEIKNFKVFIYLTQHKIFNNLKIGFKKNSVILDLNHVLDKKKKEKILLNKNLKSYFIGSKSI
jgi:UDP-N-acetyl-D-glucosamine dehydrogenase